MMRPNGPNADDSPDLSPGACLTTGGGPVFLPGGIVPTKQDFMAAVLSMTTEQMRATWRREQEWNRGRGLPHYTVLRDPVSGAILESIA